jgi:hypothetical protein
MNDIRTDGLCPDTAMAEVISVLQADDEGGLALIARLLATYPADARLHFLQGSVLAGLQRYAEGREAMARSLEIAPEYELARFQLGFLELTSGLAAEAATTWAPFADLPNDASFRLLSEGLNRLATDDFAECDRLLRLGMAANNDHPLINGDMQLVLEEIAAKIIPNAQVADNEVEPASATHLLLQQFELKDSANKTRH